MLRVMYDKILGRIREGGDASQYAEKTSTPQILIVSNILDLTDEQLDSLKAGDMVVLSYKRNLGDKTTPLYVIDDSTYVVAHKYVGTETEHMYCELVNIHDNEITEVIFSNDDDGEGWYPDYTFVRYISTPLLSKSGANSYLDVNPDMMVIFTGNLTGNKNFSLEEAELDGCAHMYHWRFSTGGTVPTITWPNKITKWAGGAGPTIAANKTYEVSVLEGLATIIEA